MFQNCPAQVTPPQVMWRHLLVPLSYFSIAWKWITEALTLAYRTEVIIFYGEGVINRDYFGIILNAFLVLHILGQSNVKRVRPGRVILKKAFTRALRPDLQLLTLLHTIFDSKVPLSHVLLTNHIPSFLSAINAQSLKYN